MTSDEAQAAADRLAELDERIDRVNGPAALLALVGEIDAFGVELAAKLRTSATPQLHRVIAGVPGVQVRAMLRAAEKLDDAGSPRRAAYVLLEALRLVFDPATLATVSTALAFTLDAHGQTEPARRVRELAALDVRATRLAAIDELRGAIDWSALDDELGID